MMLKTKTFRVGHRRAGSHCLGLISGLMLATVALSCRSQNAVTSAPLFKVAADAHRRHLSSITIGLPTVMPRTISSLDDELRSSFAIEAEPVAEVTALNSTGDEILSWYKLRIIHAFSHARFGQPETEARLLERDPSFPKQLLPVAKGDLIVTFYGGQMMIDGVNIIYGPENANLIPHKAYVFFLGPMLGRDLTRSGTVFVPLGNLAAVFKISEDGDTLIPLVPEPKSYVQGLAQEEYSNRLSKMKSRTPEVKP